MCRELGTNRGVHRYAMQRFSNWLTTSQPTPSQAEINDAKSAKRDELTATLAESAQRRSPSTLTRIAQRILESGLKDTLYHTTNAFRLRYRDAHHQNYGTCCGSIRVLRAVRYKLSISTKTLDVLDDVQVEVKMDPQNTAYHAYITELTTSRLVTLLGTKCDTQPSDDIGTSTLDDYTNATWSPCGRVDVTEQQLAIDLAAHIQAIQDGSTKIILGQPETFWKFYTDVSISGACIITFTLFALSPSPLPPPSLEENVATIVELVRGLGGSFVEMEEFLKKLTPSTQNQAGGGGGGPPPQDCRLPQWALTALLLLRLTPPSVRAYGPPPPPPPPPPRRRRKPRRRRLLLSRFL